MSIDVHVVVYNDLWMMRHFLRYYGPLADRIVVWDDRSDDGTREFVAQHPKVVLRDYPFPPGLDEAYLVAAYEQAYRESRGAAEWVILPDPDHFFVPCDGSDLRSHLDALRAEGVRAVKAIGVLCGSEEEPDTDGPLWEAMPCRRSHVQYSQILIFDPRLEVEFGWGRHHTVMPPAVPCRQSVFNYHCCYPGPTRTAARLARNFSRMPKQLYRREKRFRREMGMVPVRMREMGAATWPEDLYAYWLNLTSGGAA